MKVALPILAALSLATALARSQAAPDSAHIRGPKGLEGWKSDQTFPSPNGDRYPVELVIARHGHIIRRIPGQPFVWNWIYWKNGSEIAYEAGPLHFAMSCILLDLTSGRRITEVDCFSTPPTQLPAWANALQAHR